MKIFRYIFFFLFLPRVFAQDVHIQIEKSTIGITEPLKLSLVFPKELRKEYQAFPFYAFPEIDHFVKVKTEYEEDKERKVYLVNQYYRPLKNGVFKIRRFTFKIGHTPLVFQEKEILVTGEAGKFSMLLPGEDALYFEGEKPDIRLWVTADKKRVYSGEEFFIRAGLLIAGDNKALWNYNNLSDQAKAISKEIFPSGCSSDPYFPGLVERPAFDSIRMHGETFRRLIFFEGKYYPLSPSRIKIPATEYILTVYKIAKAAHSRWWQPTQYSLKAAGSVVEVIPLPEHPLRDKVPVGNFQLKESISSNKLTTGNSFNYVAIIQGDGNLNAVLPPPATENGIFDIFTPEVSQRTVRDATRFAGKVFNFDVIPLEPGKHALGSFFKWVYFNTDRKAYDTLKSEYVVTVSGESQKNKEISSTVLESFYELAGQESNKLRSKEKEESIKLFANIIILFMLVTTAILVFKK